MSNARVSLSRDGTTVAEGRTDNDGRFTSPVVEQGGYVLDTFKAGYYRNITRVTVNESTSMKLEMRRGTTNAQFQVVDDHFEPPRTLTDAEVRIENLGSQRTAGGTVTFTVPVNTQYQVSATKGGYVTNQTRYFVGTDPDTKTLVIQRERNLTVTPANERVVVGKQVSVTVTNAYDEPVTDAAVLFDGEQVVTTDQNGVARVKITSEGEHTLAAELGPEVPLPGFTPVTAVLAVLALVGVVLLGRLR